jgi:uncharacterized membrane protein
LLSSNFASHSYEGVTLYAGAINMAKESEKDQSISFKLERYKFILQEIHSLNENVHKYLTLYQTIASTIIGAGILVFVNWENWGIDSNTAKAGIQSLLGMLVMLSIFIIIQIIAGIFSWLDYRDEEVKLLDEVVKKGYRFSSKISNLWRWSETYFILFILIIAVFISVYTEKNLIPLIR